MIKPRIYPFDLIRSQGFDLDHIPIVPIKAKGKRTGGMGSSGK